MTEITIIPKRKRPGEKIIKSWDPAPIKLQIDFRKYMKKKEMDKEIDTDEEDLYDLPKLDYDPDKVQYSRFFSDQYKKLTKIYILNAYPYLPEDVVDSVMSKPENNSQFTLSIKYIKFGLKFKEEEVLLEGEVINILSDDRKKINVNYESDDNFIIEAAIFEKNEYDIQKISFINFDNACTSYSCNYYGIDTFTCSKCKIIKESSEKIVAGCNDNNHCLCKECFIQEANAKKTNPYLFQKCYADDDCPQLYSMNTFKKYISEGVINEMLKNLRIRSIKALKLEGHFKLWEKCDCCGEYSPSKCGNEQYHMCRRGECNYCKCRECGKGIHWGEQCVVTVELKQTEFNNYITEAMTNASLKKCPWCGILQIRVSGCNRIPCFQCKRNFCYICGIKLPGGRGPSGDPYTHFKRIGATCPLWSDGAERGADVTDDDRAKEAGKKAMNEWRMKNPRFAYLKPPTQLGLE